MQRLLFSLAACCLMMANFAQAEMVFNRSNDAEPSSMDPQLAQGIPEMHILRDMYEGLVSENAAAETIPGMAHSWDVSSDGLTYTFHLREATWSDGQPVTAEDFVYAWQRGVDPTIGSNYSFMLYPIKNAQAIAKGEAELSSLGVTAINPQTLEVQLENPTPYFIGMLTNAVAYPVPKHVVEQYGDQWTRLEHVVSNGPFVMQDWLPQATITLAKSDQYWDKDNVSLDKVVFHVTEDKNAELRRYRAGELDWTSDVPSDQMQWMNEHLSDELHINNYLGTYYYGFNLTKAPFKDNIELREALTLAINRELIVDKITAAGETAAYSFVVPGVSHYFEGYQPPYTSLTNEERIVRAKELYAEAGYSKENPLEIELLYSNSDNNRRIAIAIASMWKESLGVETNLVNKEWKAYLNDRREKNTQVFRASWIGDYDDPNTFLELWQSASTSNSIGFNDPEYDKLIQAAASEQDMDKRAQLLSQAEQRLLDNYSLIPIYFYVSKHLVKPYVSGYAGNVMNHWPSKYIQVDK
ncbi:peptide ABC transporter substrate-binding protein [Suttonella sp. R2A3]|uniref:peptide ABC transporter substrate-binding protein n=1 Tax=Suttonella sp. R2A3 TaxID=2908648 RepID=UPI001F19BBA3|nr:peptide ABC transporter substrate-binding protein [Suttonella sp. R2A3]UJF25167.1 peptide ABC transporter substrate-binding protein [Suttonella sp. R2A3]